MSSVYEKLIQRVKDVGRMRSIEQLLEWDQDVYMPQHGVTARAEQMALIAGMAHERFVADETRDLLAGANAPDADQVAQTNIRETQRQFDRSVKVPVELVKKIAHASSHAKSAWAEARRTSTFATFAPHLGELIDLKKQVADRVGYTTEPYDALMDEFEPEAKAAEMETLFASLREFTVTLLARTKGAPRQPDASVLTRHFPKEVQATLTRKFAESLGFDFDSGRSDVSVHPFCLTIGGPGDVRITTRYLEDFLPAALFGTLHETGHALYEQGLPAEHALTPCGEAISLGIHESQSRMWENLVGRSFAFWTYHYDELKRAFPEALGDVSLEAFYAAINAVRPSMIRVEADELTYNLHIILRFEIERALMTGALAVEDVPAAWNEKMRQSLGVVPENDAEGCLQDIHWSLGIFGYFPTYALGNLYAAQFFDKARADIPDLDARIAANDHKPLLNWLRENIHRHGQRYRAGELVEHVTGTPLSIEPFTKSITEKVERVYGPIRQR